MKKYFKVFMIITFARIGKELSLRFNLIFEMAGSFIFFVLHTVSFYIVVGNFNFPDWSVGELWILMATFQIFTYLSFFLFWKGLTRTVEEIRLGTLDAIIVKPIDSRFMSFLRSGGFHNFAAALAGVILLIFVTGKYTVGITLPGVILYVFSLILSLWLIHCLSVIIVSFNFFFGHLKESSGMIFSFQESFKYPSNLYQSREFIIRLVFIPLSLLTTYPALLILSKPSSQIILWVITTTVLLSLTSHWLWHKGLSLYSSASS